MQKIQLENNKWWWWALLTCFNSASCHWMYFLSGCERFPVVTSVPYGVLEITSGAIQYGVPTRDFLFGTSLLIWAQKPKSDSFICSRRRRKLFGLSLQDRTVNFCWLYVFVLRELVCSELWTSCVCVLTHSASLVCSVLFAWCSSLNVLSSEQLTCHWADLESAEKTTCGGLRLNHVYWILMKRRK